MLTKQNDNPYNPFGIPNLQPMTDAVTDFVRRYQGEKGYVDTQDEGADTIWGYRYGMDNTVHENQVKAVRVNPQTGALECIMDDQYTDWNEDSLQAACKADRDNSPWEEVQYGENVMYVQTLFNIAEFIEEYVSGGIALALEGKDVDAAPDILKQFGEVRFVDEKIDDGCDSDEDEYVMMRSYDAGEFYVRIYYGNNTRTVTYVDAERRR